MHYQKRNEQMKRLPLRTTIVLICLGVVALISITVQQTFSKNLAAPPRVGISRIGTSTPIHAKSLVAPRVSNVLQVSAGGDHTCAIHVNSSVKCWGSNSSGQLGYGDIIQRGGGAGEMGANLPVVDLGTNHTAIQISAGDNHNCAILENFTLKCWGNSENSKLGLNTNQNRGDNTSEMGDNLPIVNLGSGKTALAVSASTNHTCAILNDHTLKCWGNNGSGQLGYGNNTTLNSPSASAIDLSNSHTALAVSAGIAHTCAILDDNTVHCWGDNT